MFRQLIAIAVETLEATFDAPLVMYRGEVEPVEVVIVSRRKPSEVQAELREVYRAQASLWERRRHQIQDAYNDNVQKRGVVFAAWVGPDANLSTMRRSLEQRQKELEHELRFAISYQRNPNAYQRG